MTEPARFPAGRPLLIRGATVVTVDEARGVRSDTDVLVVGERIAAVSRGLSAPHDAVVIEAEGALLSPGFVDTHRHMWQSALRGLGVDWTLTNYLEAIGALLPHLRPEDVYAGNERGEQVVAQDPRAADVLRYATLGGAEALGMGDRIGSITPGKLADLVLLRRDTPSMVPVLVFQAGRGDVDTVVVGGRVRGHGGEPVGLDLTRARRLAEASRDHLRAAGGEATWR
ncbi:hypothetical protein E1265_21180 [Streptomyces sp. 8K308]|uniref:amidohydrolase family protein n=1 Tax=Streptomyces sp. 8K308 TaxID=2530388 RepID=UPI00104730AD|nr:amidohydrolase family protein [Streptomyces sp. 8K308]TDC20657.1 hypothetical protein E1265_21180 [Streptomyces sp. 8K308]